MKEGLEGFMDSTEEGVSEANRKGWGQADNPSRQDPAETAHMKTDEDPRSPLSSIYRVGDIFEQILHVIEQVQREFNSPDFDEIKSRLNTNVIYDARNLYDTKKTLANGFDYFAIGKHIPQS